MVSNKLVSIIVPVYNGEKYIESTLKTILNSYHKNIEIIVVNDGSNDSSCAICEKMAEQNKKIKFFSKENGGIVSARNYGLQKANGDYIAFCDQDDIVFPNMYSDLVKQCENNKADLGLIGTVRKIENSDELFPSESFTNGVFDKERINSHFLYPLIFHPFKPPIDMSLENQSSTIWKGLYRKDFLSDSNIRFKRFINFEDDFIFLAECYLCARKIVTLQKVGYCWRINPNSESHVIKYYPDLEERQKKYLDYFLDLFKKNNIPDDIVKWFIYVTRCKYYMMLLDNMTTPYNSESWKKKKSIIKNSIYNSNYKENLQAKKYLKKGRVQLGVLLNVIPLHSSTLDYLINLGLNKLNSLATRSAFLTGIERKLKK